MKKKLLSFAVIVLSLCIFSASSFAQEVPGGSGDGGGGTPPDEGGTGGGTVTQSTGFHFTRNNGDGTCGQKAQIRLYYTIAPTAAPVLTQIYYQGQPLFANFQPVTGDISGFATKGYVSFCINTSNLPPAIKLTLTYNASSTQQNISISGTD